MTELTIYNNYFINAGIFDNGHSDTHYSKVYGTFLNYTDNKLQYCLRLSQIFNIL